jgi:hypothetical protein
LDAACEGRLPRKTEVARRLESDRFEVVRTVQVGCIGVSRQVRDTGARWFFAFVRR